MHRSPKAAPPLVACTRAGDPEPQAAPKRPRLVGEGSPPGRLADQLRLPSVTTDDAWSPSSVFDAVDVPPRATREVAPTGATPARFGAALTGERSSIQDNQLHLRRLKEHEVVHAALLRDDGPQQQEALHRDGVRDLMCHDSIEEAGVLRALADPAAMRARAARAPAAAADGGVDALLGLHSAGCERDDAANGAVVNVASDDGADGASGSDANPEGEEDASAALVQQQEATATAAVAFSARQTEAHGARRRRAAD